MLLVVGAVRCVEAGAAICCEVAVARYLLGAVHLVKVAVANCFPDDKSRHAVVDADHCVEEVAAHHVVVDESAFYVRNSDDSGFGSGGRSGRILYRSGSIATAYILRYARSDW